MKRLEEIPGVEKEADRDKGGEEIWNQTIIGVMARYLWVFECGCDLFRILLQESNSDC